MDTASNPQTTHNTIRTFIGSPLKGSAVGILETLYAQRTALESQWQRKASWVSPDNWHLTWLFLGNTPTSDIPDMQERLAQAVDGIESPQLTLETLAFWPNNRNARLLVLASNKNDRGILRVATQIRQAFPEHADPKPFRPHITLARLKTKERNNTRIPRESLDALLPQSCVFSINEVVLYQSTLTPKGSIYTHLFRTELD